MIVEADVNVRNKIPGTTLQVTRIRPGEPEDTTIDAGSVVCFPALNTEESLIIDIPQGIDVSEYPLGVSTSIADVRVSCSPNKWTVNIFPNEMDPEVPTTVNINAGDPGEG